MWFTVGIGEFCVVGGLVLIAAMLAVLRLRAWRWAMIGLVSAIVATIFSPADPLSTILLAVVFLVFFAGGARFGMRRSVAASNAQEIASP